jgi:two-component system cell cycle sensor histidine kinase/response regulator CckA
VAMVLRVLLVEDSADDARLLVRQLTAAGYDVQHERVETPAAMRDALTRLSWDLVISDYSMPSFSGTAALTLLQELGIDVPFIFVSGTIGEDVAVAAMKAGASDYVLKDKLKRLVPAIERELRDAEMRRERRRGHDIVLERTRLAELTSDVGVALTSVIPLRESLASCARALVRHLDVLGAAVWTYAEQTKSLELLASAGLPAQTAERLARLSLEDAPIGQIARDRLPLHLAGGGLAAAGREWVEQEGITAFGGYPLLVEERVVGVLAVFSKRLVPDYVLDGLEAVADQLAVGIERRRAEEELRQSEERFSRVFRASPAGIAITTADDGRFVDANDAFFSLTGYGRSEIIGRTAAELGFVQDLREQADLLEELRELGTVQNVDLELRTKQGDRRFVLASFERIELGGRPCLLSLMHDISERKRLEDQLRQAQKMEAVGRLAGGVAHDFNNLLSVIIGYCDLLFRTLPPDARERAEIAEIRDAADAASGLTRQLLAFSRRQVVERQVLDLNAVVTKAERLLKRLVGDDIELVVRLAPVLAAVLADAGQLDQVLMNLVVNAKDAMPAGGRVVLETAPAELDEAFVRDHPGARAGRYVRLSVSDTGIGMDPETQAHIFEPFFTTKEIGRGTGLGLATVYGIVKQNDAFIWVESARALGTTFRIDFPAAAAAAAPEPAPRIEPASLLGSETVLVVEDSPQLRELMREVLQGRGYHILDAENGEAALETARQHEGPIHLLLTDVIMPGMNGRQLADRLTAVRSDLRVLFASGYTADALAPYGMERGVPYMQKPFTPDDLARRVRAILDAPP